MERKRLSRECPQLHPDEQSEGVKGHRVCACCKQAMSTPAIEHKLEDQFFLAQAKAKITRLEPSQFQELQKLSISLLESFVTQRAATRWVMVSGMDGAASARWSRTAAEENAAKSS